jgi:pimeloyl-ACP methyl ester carboxylesterase
MHHPLRPFSSTVTDVQDLRNHGQSPHAEPHTSAAMAEDLAYLFRREAMEKVHLVGHSM